MVTSHPKTQVNLQTDIQDVSVEADSNAMQSGYPGSSLKETTLSIAEGYMLFVVFYRMINI